jgi:hypothetical protein
MFLKKKEATVKPTEAETGPPKSKAKKLSPKGIIINQIEQLAPEHAVTYRLPEGRGGNLAVVELNPQYPGKGRKYTMSFEKLVDGKPSGKRSHIWDSDKPKDVAGWILSLNGELFSRVEEGSSVPM